MSTEYDEARNAVLNMMLIDCESRHVRGWAVALQCDCRAQAEEALNRLGMIICAQGCGCDD